MRLTRLDLRRSRGLVSNYVLEDLSPGFNIITGSNGSGKSSLCRAISGMLWNEEVFEGSVQADWVLGETKLSALREGDGPKWTLETGGEYPGIRNAVPESRFRGCFTFSTDDFLMDEETDKEIHHVIHTELLAGFDLTKVLGDRRRITAASATVTKEKNALQSAVRAAEAVRDEHRELLVQERLLTEKRESLQLARSAQELTSRYADALKLADMRDALLEAESKLAAYPSSMKLLRGDELSLLEQRRQELERSTLALGELQSRLESERKKWKSTGLKQPVATEHLSVLQSREPRLRDLESLERAAEKEERAASACLEEVYRALPSSVDAKSCRINLEELRQLEDTLDELENLNARAAEFQERLDAAKDGVAQSDMNAPLDSAIGLLSRWLEGDAGAPLHRLLPFGLIVFGTTLLILATLGALLFPVALIGGVCLAGLGGWLAMQSGGGERASLEHKFESLPLDAPQSWETETVIQRVAELQQDVARQQAGRFEVTVVRKCTQKLEQVSQARAAAFERLTESSQRCGLDVDSTRAGLLAVARELQLSTEANQSLAAARANKKLASSDKAQELLQVNQVLARYDLDPIQDAEELRASADALQARESQRSGASQRVTELKQEEVQAKEAIAQQQEALNGFLTGLGLGTLGERELAQNIERLPEWNREQAAKGRLQAEVGTLESHLANYPELAQLDRQRALQEKKENEERSKALTVLQDEVASIKHTVQTARRGHALEDAMAEEDHRRGILTETRDELLQAAAAAFLLDGVAEEHQNLAQPDILREAGVLFGEFTRHRYELRAVTYAKGEDALPFEIHETRGSTKRVSELSTGTRSQLGLALRLAVAQSVEAGECLPILLDEALNNSDPERFNYVVRSLKQLVDSGRQVFFLTSDPTDGKRLQEQLIELGMGDVRHLDLDQIRGEARSAEVLETVPVPRVPVPAAGELGADYAARLRVPRIDAFAGVDAMHLYYLCSDDLEGLHSVLVERVDTVGGTRQLLINHEDVWRPERRARFEARCVIARAWLDQYAVGRTLPLLPEVLRTGAAGKSKYIEELVELNDELGRDATQLVACMDVKAKDRDPRLKGFSKSVRDKLCADLKQHELLTTDEFISAAERLGRCLVASQGALDEGAATREEVVQLVNEFEQWLGVIA